MHDKNRNDHDPHGGPGLRPSASLDPSTGDHEWTRRGLLRGAAMAATAAGVGLPPSRASAQTMPGSVFADDPQTRALAARTIRRQASQASFLAFPSDTQEINADEQRYDDLRGSFSKTLPHTELGEVQGDAYQSMLEALDARVPAGFEAITVGRDNDPSRVRLANPQAAYAFELSGLDGNASRIPPAPAVDSAIVDAEMAELYWYAVTRDVPFAEYERRNIICRAARDLNQFSRRDIFAHNDVGDVTPNTLFRGSIPVVGAADGVLNGPFVSQFLLLPFQLGQLEVDQRYRRVARGAANQFLTRFDGWLAVQEGQNPNATGNSTTFTSQSRYIARMRDLAEWVHRDYPLQAPTQALAIILGFGDAALDRALPYLREVSDTQSGFVTFGLADVSNLITLAIRQALVGAWFQKWACHRRLRPEQYAARINAQLRGRKDYELGLELMGSAALDRAIDEVREVNCTPFWDDSNDGLLPMAFPEGSPAHPAYPAGHSTSIAAGITVLKAFVDETFEIPDPVVPDRYGHRLEAWRDSSLTLGGELNKLVANITHARDAAGVHWRSDGVGNLIGEDAAIALLADYSLTRNEDIDGLTLTRFDGRAIRIVNGEVFYA
ncbi:MAG: phosphoesterase [Myxococcales bacterium FL481]|nr:MAG: phosphoesterase [Myxococcales bacterium FL481]